jgi:branched-chain amino acid transport system ATP-binding protein
MSIQPVAATAKDDKTYAAQAVAHGIEPHVVGEPVMEMKNITLRFGGLTAIKDISFDIREGELRAIIGPNGAGKSSMLNVINGFYHPQDGEIWFRGKKRGPMKPYQIAHQGIARTFHRVVQGHVHARQHHDRAHDPHEPEHVLAEPVVGPCRA